MKNLYRRARALVTRAVTAFGRAARTILPDVALGHEKAIAAAVTAAVTREAWTLLHLQLPGWVGNLVTAGVTSWIVHITTNTPQEAQP